MECFIWVTSKNVMEKYEKKGKHVKMNMTLRGLSVACRLASPLLLLSSRLRFPKEKKIEN